MDAINEILHSRQRVGHFLKLTEDLLTAVFCARLLDNNFDELCLNRSEDGLKKVLEEMAQNVSKFKENEEDLHEILKNFDGKASIMMINFYASLSRVYKSTYENIKLQCHLKYEV